jgi:hypothetical protein
MPQVAAWYQLSGQPWFTVVECPRRDCEQRAKAYNIDGPWKPWEGPVPTGSLAQLVLEERPFMEALSMQWNHARTLAEEWTQEHRGRPLPSFVRELMEEIYDRATEL